MLQFGVRALPLLLLSSAACAESVLSTNAQINSIAAAINEHDAGAIDRVVKHIQIPEGLKQISSKELVTKTLSCSVGKISQRASDYWQISLECPEREPSEKCRASGMSLSIITDEAGPAKVELAEQSSLAADCQFAKEEDG